MTLKGKVAEVLDRYRVVANIGSDDGVEHGMEFEIYEEKGGYTDPDTGEELGTRTVVKAKVEVVELHAKMSVLESSESERYNPIREQFSVFGTKRRTKELPTASNIEVDETTIERGDLIKKRMDPEDEE